MTIQVISEHTRRVVNDTIPWSIKELFLAIVIIIPIHNVNLAIVIMEYSYIIKKMILNCLYVIWFYIIFSAKGLQG